MFVGLYQFRSIMNQHPPGGTGESRAPLAPPVLYILVALAAGPRIARDVFAEVRRLSAESVSERTMRRLLGRMEALDVVSGRAERSGASSPDFALTALGVAILVDEIQRLKSLIDRVDVQALCAAAAPGTGRT